MTKAGLTWIVEVPQNRGILNVVKDKYLYIRGVFVTN